MGVSLLEASLPCSASTQSRIVENPQTSFFALGNPDSRLASQIQAIFSPLSLLCLNSCAKNNTQLFLTCHQLIDLVHLYTESLSLKLGVFCFNFTSRVLGHAKSHSRERINTQKAPPNTWWSFLFILLRRLKLFLAPQIHFRGFCQTWQACKLR